MIDNQCSNAELKVIDISTGELVSDGHKTDDEWEAWIKQAHPSQAIFEYAKRIHEFFLDCRDQHGKQGGSHFTDFMFERFGMQHPLPATWNRIGQHHGELVSNTDKFAPDYTALYGSLALTKDKSKLCSLRQGL